MSLEGSVIDTSLQAELEEQARKGDVTFAEGPTRGLRQWRLDATLEKYER